MLNLYCPALNHNPPPPAVVPPVGLIWGLPASPSYTLYSLLSFTPVFNCQNMGGSWTGGMMEGMEREQKEGVIYKKEIENHIVI